MKAFGVSWSYGFTIPAAVSDFDDDLRAAVPAAGIVCLFFFVVTGNGRAISVEMERHHSRRHHREARIVESHLMDRTVRALNRQLHQVFDVFAVGKLLTKGFVQDIHCRLRSHFACVGAANSIGNDKDAALAVRQKRVFVQRPLLAQATIRDRANVDMVRR